MLAYLLVISMLLDRKLLQSLLLALLLHAALLIFPKRHPVFPVTASHGSRVEIQLNRSSEATASVDHAESASVPEKPATEDSPEQAASAVADSLLDRVTQAVPVYLTARELDESPQPMQPIVVPNPESPLGRAEGYLQLQLWIDRQGRVERVEELAGDVPKEYVDLAKKTFLQASFAPGLKNNAPVAASIRLEIKFFESIRP